MLTGMAGSLLVARIFGIDIRIHLSWLVIFGLVLLTLSDQILPERYPFWSDQKTLIVAAIAALLFFCSVLAHELAHALVARRFKMSVSSITLFLLGGVANLTKEPPSAKAEFFMAAAGPFTSLCIGGLGVLIATVAEAPVLQPVQAVADYLGWVNIALALFNMVPGFPLDGGRVLRSAVWAVRKDRSVATRVAGRGGQIVAGLLALFGLVVLVRFHNTFGIWYAFIGYFLFNAASSALQQDRIAGAVGGATVAQLMSTQFTAVPSGTSLAALVRDHLLPQNLRAAPVIFGTRFLGLVSAADLRKVEQEQWGSTPVDRVMRPTDDLSTVTPEDRLLTAVERFGESPVLAVVRGGTLIGVLDRDAVFGYIRMRDVLGIDRR